MTAHSKKIMMYMIKEISQFKYAYRSTIEGCYECAIAKYGVSEDSKESIVDEVILILNLIEQGLKCDSCGAHLKPVEERR